MLHAAWGDLDIDHVVRPLGQVTLCKTQPREEGCLRTSARDYILTHPDWYTSSAAAFMGGGRRPSALLETKRCGSLAGDACSFHDAHIRPEVA